MEFEPFIRAVLVMAGILLSGVSESERNSFPTLSQLSENDVENIWANASSFIERQMSMQKGVHIAGLGSFTFSQLDMGGRLDPILRPIFLLSEKLSQCLDLKQDKPLAVAGQVPVVPLNFAALTVESPLEREQVEGCVRESLLLLRRAVAAQRSVFLHLRSVGVLTFRHGKVKMRFYRDFLNAVDGTGKLHSALANRPGTSVSVMSGTVSSLQGPGTSWALVLPRIPEQGQDTRVEEDSPRPPCEEDQGVGHCNGESWVPPRPRSRQTFPPLASARSASLPTEPEAQAPPAPASRRFTGPSQPPEGAQTAGEEGRRERVQSRRCRDHPGAGQELCYVCMQRARRNIPLYLAEERTKEDQEEARILMLHQHHKDLEYLLSEQTRRQEMRESQQRAAAYNLGVAEALRGRKTAESHGSYLLSRRAPTPPPRPGQQRYMLELQQQVTRRCERHTQSAQHQRVLDRLHQFQLANQLASQKEQQLQQKRETLVKHREALEAQLELKEPGIPARQPDSDGPVFGRQDGDPADLAEQRRWARAVRAEQMSAAAWKRRDAALTRLGQQQQESDTLKHSRMEHMADRIAHYERLQHRQASLVESWDRGVDRKRQRDQEERDFIRRGGQLLMDQCAQYRRCNQCQRRPENRGESHVMRDARYVPGLRLMV